MAITHHVRVKFSYNDKLRVVNPYKLLNNNGVWCLLCDEADALKTFTFSKILNASLCENESFKPKQKFVKEIENNQKSWFSASQTEVILQIDNAAKEYFLRKQALSNYKILEKTTSNFTISTNISYDDEALNFVKLWIPYAKIISPIHLKEKLVKILEEYLKTT